MPNKREIIIDKRKKPDYGCVVTTDRASLVISGEPGEIALLMNERLKSDEYYDLFLRLVRVWALMEKRCFSRALFSDLEVPEHPELGRVELTCLPGSGKEAEWANMWLVLDVSVLDHFLTLTKDVAHACHDLAPVGRSDQLVLMNKWDSMKIGVRLGLSEFVGLFQDQIEALEDMLAQQEEKLGQ